MIRKLREVGCIAEGMQWDGSLEGAARILFWLQGAAALTVVSSKEDPIGPKTDLAIHLHVGGGTTRARSGDWIIKEDGGSLRALTDADMRTMYLEEEG